MTEAEPRTEPEPRTVGVGRFRLTAPAAVAALVTLAFIGLSIWWLLYDKRVPGGGDPARHLSLAITYGGWLADGDIGSMFTKGAEFGDFFYPPLVHLVGAVPEALGLEVQDWGTIAMNLVFVPMLAAGCFGVARMTYGPTAGVLAVVFALGTPMVLSLFHVFLLDAPLAAIVALALWALLASDRFQRRRETAIAGALVGLAVMVKSPAPLFLAGPAAVMLIGGGWRQWRNLLIAAGVALLIAGPYYLINVGELAGTSATATVVGNPDAPGLGYDSDPRFSLDNLAYYGWVAANLQFFLPLLVLFAIGLVLALRELRRRRYVPELLAGLVVGYLGPTLILVARDPRYTLPLVVYVAVIATGWITVARRAAVTAIATAALVAVVVVNVGAAVVDDYPTARVSLPGDRPSSPGDDTLPGELTVIDGRGYVVGPPRPDPFWDRLLDAAEAEGMQTEQLLAHETPLFGTDVVGFDVLALGHGITGPTYEPTDEPPDLRVQTWWTSDDFWVGEMGLPEPCAHVEEGAQPAPSSDPVELSVAVERRVDGRYERWCDF